MHLNTRCPHADVKFCPLYVAMHIAGAGGCDDGKLDHGGCAVDRGMNYQKELQRLEIEQFAIVAECQWLEKSEQQQAQKRRNLADNGIH